MILATTQVIKFLLLVAGITTTLIFFCREWDRKSAAAFGAFLVLGAFIANFAAGRLPPLTDEVILTALDEKREGAAAEEISLTGYTVDGISYSAGKSLQIERGKWFWSGERYMWRSETDSRQPAGTTRSITVRVPVGWERNLNFLGDIWKGKVEIVTNGGAQVVDTFSEGYSLVSVPIGRSRTSALILNQVRDIAAYTLILLELTVIAVAGARLWMRRPEQCKMWLKRNNGKLLYTVLSITAGCLMFRYSGDVSLWADELLQVDSACGTLQGVIQNCLIMRDATPPLYGICAWMWYHIVPFGERWLLLVSVVPTTAAVYVMGLMGEKLRGKYCGALAACLLAFSTTVWHYAAFEFRSYAFVLFFSTLSLYCHLQRNLQQEKRRWLVVYSFSLLGLAMSHYFGMLLFGLFFLADLYLYGTKRISQKSALSYILPGSVSVLWLYLVFRTTLQYRTPEMIASWYPRPTLQGIGWLLRTLSGNYTPSFYIFLLGVAWVLMDTGKEGDHRKEWFQICQRMLLWMVCAAVVVMYIYGNYINSKSTMWETRYFIILISPITLLSASGMVSLFAGNDEKGKMRLKVAVTLVGILLFDNCLQVNSIGAVTQPFREAADWLYLQSDYIFNSDTVIVQTWIPESWQAYYICRRTRRDPLNVIGQYSLSETELLSFNKVYIQYSHIPISEWLQAELNENYVMEEDLPDIQMKVYTRK